MKKLLMAAALLFTALPPHAFANMDAGLYDPLPPPNSAFVRFLGNHPGKGSDPVKANGKIFDYLDYAEVSSYFVIPGGNLDAQIGSASGSFDIESGKFYTVILGADGRIDIKEDPRNDNQAKAQVILYNFSGDNGLALKTADGKVEIVPALPPGQASDRQVNPVKVPLAVYDGDRKIKDLGSVSLERSRSYSLFVLNDRNIEWVRSSTNTTR